MTSANSNSATRLFVHNNKTSQSPIPKFSTPNRNKKGKHSRIHSPNIDSSNSEDSSASNPQENVSPTLSQLGVALPLVSKEIQPNRPRLRNPPSSHAMRIIAHPLPAQPSSPLDGETGLGSFDEIFDALPALPYSQVSNQTTHAFSSNHQNAAKNTENFDVSRMNTSQAGGISRASQPLFAAPGVAHLSPIISQETVGAPYFSVPIRPPANPSAINLPPPPIRTTLSSAVSSSSQMQFHPIHPPTKDSRQASSRESDQMLFEFDSRLTNAHISDSSPVAPRPVLHLNAFFNDRFGLYRSSGENSLADHATSSDGADSNYDTNDQNFVFNPPVRVTNIINSLFDSKASSTQQILHALTENPKASSLQTLPSGNTPGVGGHSQQVLLSNSLAHPPLLINRTTFQAHEDSLETSVSPAAHLLSTVETPLFRHRLRETVGSTGDSTSRSRRFSAPPLIKLFIPDDTGQETSQLGDSSKNHARALNHTSGDNQERLYVTPLQNLSISANSATSRRHSSPVPLPAPLALGLMPPQLRTGPSVSQMSSRATSLLGASTSYLLANQVRNDALEWASDDEGSERSLDEFAATESSIGGTIDYPQPASLSGLKVTQPPLTRNKSANLARRGNKREIKKNQAARQGGGMLAAQEGDADFNDLDNHLLQDNEINEDDHDMSLLKRPSRNEPEPTAGVRRRRMRPGPSLAADVKHPNKRFNSSDDEDAVYDGKFQEFNTEIQPSQRDKAYAINVKALSSTSFENSDCKTPINFLQPSPSSNASSANSSCNSSPLPLTIRSTLRGAVRRSNASKTIPTAEIDHEDLDEGLNPSVRNRNSFQAPPSFRSHHHKSSRTRKPPSAANSRLESSLSSGSREQEDVSSHLRINPTSRCTEPPESARQSADSATRGDSPPPTPSVNCNSYDRIFPALPSVRADASYLSIVYHANDLLLVSDYSGAEVVLDGIKSVSPLAASTFAEACLFRFLATGHVRLAANCLRRLDSLETILNSVSRLRNRVSPVNPQLTTELKSYPSYGLTLLEIEMNVMKAVCLIVNSEKMKAFLALRSAWTELKKLDTTILDPLCQKKKLSLKVWMEFAQNELPSLLANMNAVFKSANRTSPSGNNLNEPSILPKFLSVEWLSAVSASGGSQFWTSRLFFMLGAVSLLVSLAPSGLLPVLKLAGFSASLDRSISLICCVALVTNTHGTHSATTLSPSASANSRDMHMLESLPIRAPLSAALLALAFLDIDPHPESSGAILALAMQSAPLAVLPQWVAALASWRLGFLEEARFLSGRALFTLGSRLSSNATYLIYQLTLLETIGLEFAAAARFSSAIVRKLVPEKLRMDLAELFDPLTANPAVTFLLTSHHNIDKTADLTNTNHVHVLHGTAGTPTRRIMSQTYLRPTSEGSRRSSFPQAVNANEGNGSHLNACRSPQPASPIRCHSLAAPKTFLPHKAIALIVSSAARLACTGDRPTHGFLLLETAVRTVELKQAAASSLFSSSKSASKLDASLAMLGRTFLPHLHPQPRFDRNLLAIEVLYHLKQLSSLRPHYLRCVKAYLEIFSDPYIQALCGVCEPLVHARLVRPSPGADIIIRLNEGLQMAPPFTRLPLTRERLEPLFECEASIWKYGGVAIALAKTEKASRANKLGIDLRIVVTVLSSLMLRTACSFFLGEGSSAEAMCTILYAFLTSKLTASSDGKLGGLLVGFKDFEDYQYLEIHSLYWCGRVFSLRGHANRAMECLTRAHTLCSKVKGFNIHKKITAVINETKNNTCAK